LNHTGNMPRENHAVPVSDWLAALVHPERLDSFRAAYGEKAGLITERVALVRQTLTAFQKRFGDLPVRVFRAPGRINLRGMHVDTHGGYLNLMTHQREVVLVTTLSEDGQNILANVDPAHAETAFFLDAEIGHAGGSSWFKFISHPDIRRRVDARRNTPGHVWTNYGIGAALRVRHAFPECRLPALKILVHSDLPSGAALSSSAALSIGTLQAYAGHAGCPLSLEHGIRAEQDVEWYAGARVGMSDQTAILMGRPEQVLHLALFAEDFHLHNARYYPFPRDLALLVINSHTKRNLSGAQRVQYSLNRFAYSMAITVLQAELLRAGWDTETVACLDRLSRLTPEILGGPARTYKLLRNIPETIDLDALRERYAPPDLDEAYARYFDGLLPEEQPRQIPLRGPLLFGIAESERARLFPELLQEDYAQAGTLMCIGHDGDRIRGRDGASFQIKVDDAALNALARENTPLAHCPGCYGASSPALDALVDAALDGGALGASLTGAGLAGAVIALCRMEDTEQVAEAVQRCLRSSAYARTAARPTPLTATEARQAVIVNHAVAGACELLPT